MWNAKLCLVLLNVMSSGITNKGWLVGPRVEGCGKDKLRDQAPGVQGQGVPTVCFHDQSLHVICSKICKIAKIHQRLHEYTSNP